MRAPVSEKQGENQCEDEINLSELIDILIKRKGFILGGAFVCAFVVGLFTVLSPRLYQSDSLILVSPSIVKPSSTGDEGAQVSEIAVSTLEASTYEVLAKSDALMLALADSLKARLDPDILLNVYGETDIQSLARTLKEVLHVELLQDQGPRNTRFATPLLKLQYQAQEESLPPIVVNTWSSIFLHRNQGLSSNVTDDFYQNMVMQYSQAKSNLEEKEDELAKVEASSSDLNRLRTEINFKTVLLDSALNEYQFLKTQIQQKTRELNYVSSSLNEVEKDGVWIGYLEPDSIGDLSDVSPMRYNLLLNIKETKKLYQDSSLTVAKWNNKKNELETKHNLEKLTFEIRTDILSKRLEHQKTNYLLKQYNIERVESKSKIDSLETLANALLKQMSGQEPVLITRKAIVDEALWNLTNNKGQIKVETQRELKDYSLVSEEINPVHLGLNQRLTEINSLITFLKERRHFIEEDISLIESRIKILGRELIILQNKEYELHRQQIEEKSLLEQSIQRGNSDINLQLNVKREAFKKYKYDYESMKLRQEELQRELVKLDLALSFHVENYESWRNNVIALSVKVDSLSLKRRRIERDITVYQESFRRLAKLQEEARIARQQAAGDIQVVSRAAFAQPISQQTLLKVCIAALIGLIALSMYSIAVHFQSRP